ncbi:hypothetical protein [Rhizobium sp. BK251]|uniref:hypothetical protein n=1 Tax=Rhizobium sp. BK251 TaxID=2512125 RepID=UPI001049FBC5|nr:hypothetical protein [Rhizobium sp. BK251]TCL69450.1 hypothetical protein EV286_10822 [Rhizobium sp. BK251]
MSYDQNEDPDLRGPTTARSRSTFWAVWATVAAVVVVGAAVWILWGSELDPGTTASTSPISQPEPQPSIVIPAQPVGEPPSSPPSNGPQQ